MSLLRDMLRAADRLSPPREVAAHCDIPCGIYDPHQSQVAALTVIRMMQLIQNLEQPGSGDKAAMDNYIMQMARYTVVKEEHAQMVEKEVQTLWADYFRPEHLEQHPNLHDLVWKTAKLSGTVRQQINMQAAQDLLANCQQIAEIFWSTKGVKTRRQPSNQPTGGEIVYPVAG